MPFQMHQHSSLGEIISWNGVSPNLRKVQTLRDMPPKYKMELQSFLDILNYLSKFSPVTAEVCEPLWKGWMVMEWDVPWVIWQGQKIHLKRCMKEILWCFKAFIPRDRCIWHWPCSHVCYRCERVWTVGMMTFQIMHPSAHLLSPVKPFPVWNGDTASLKGKY